MSIYGRVVTAGYDRFMARPERTVLRQHRRTLLRAAGGNVLEIGAGTGGERSLLHGVRSPRSS